jgi:hypothetical protein
MQKYNMTSYLQYLRIFSVTANSFISIDLMYGFFVTELTFLALLLTFGTIFPPLSIPFIIVISRRMFYHNAIIGRYVLNVIKSKSDSYLDIMNTLIILV